eukprot:11849207-Karenia_brevis.AAC.1
MSAEQKLIDTSSQYHVNAHILNLAQRLIGDQNGSIARLTATIEITRDEIESIKNHGQYVVVEVSRPEDVAGSP